jgi:hypothetical protein
MGDQSDIGVHVYRVSAGNKATTVVIGVLLFCIAGYLCSGLFIPLVRARFAHQGLNTAAIAVFALGLCGLALFSAIRPFKMQVIITNSQVEVVDAFSSHIVPFTDIAGYRSAAGRGVRGMYLYRRGKSRVFVRESSFRRDDFYNRWKASIYDLDQADRLKRKTAFKQRLTDQFFEDSEQHPTIGGPDVSA